MDERTKEIRQILLGRCQKTEDGCLAVLPAGEHRRLRGFQGVSEGWGALHFFGVTHRDRSCPLPAGTPKKRLEECMKAMGQTVRLEKSHGLSACLFQYRMAAPILLTANWDGNCVEMSAYTARDALAPFLCRRALRTLESRLKQEKH